MDKSTLTLALLLTLYTVLAFGKQFYEMQEYETQDKMKQNEEVEEPVEFKQEIKDGVAETLAAYIPSGYMGCYIDQETRILETRLSDSGSNRGDECKSRCNTAGYRYAGTEYRIECFCGNSIRNYPRISGCTATCPGRYDEYCGGTWYISIYDTWPCIHNPCRNGATCTNVNANSYRCTCTAGWTGTNCDQVACSQRHVSFTAISPTKCTVSPGSDIIFGHVAHNEGGGYDANTGVFTAPVSGLYQFTAYFCNKPGKEVTYAMVYNGNEVARGVQYSTGGSCSSNTALINMASNGRVWLTCTYPSVILEDRHRRNSFMGVLLH